MPEWLVNDRGLPRSGVKFSVEGSEPPLVTMITTLDVISTGDTGFPIAIKFGNLEPVKLTLKEMDHFLKRANYVFESVLEELSL